MPGAFAIVVLSVAAAQLPLHASTNRWELGAAVLEYVTPKNIPVPMTVSLPVKASLKVCNVELPRADTREEAASCLESWMERSAAQSADHNHSLPSLCRRTFGGVGSLAGEDRYAMQRLSSNSKRMLRTTTAQWAHALWSSGQRPRFFFEAGAYNGLTMSNTLVFERCLNWTGVLVEASPIHYHNLVHAESNRGHSHRVHAAPNCREPGHVNISSGGTESTLAFHRTASRRGFEVPCVPLQLILSHLGTFRFDVFSLDVEGYELEVLKTLDLSQTSAQLMIIEAKNRQCGGTCPKRDAVRTLLATAGYTRVEGFRSGFLGKNDVFVPQMSHDLHAS